MQFLAPCSDTLLPSALAWGSHFSLCMYPTRVMSDAALGVAQSDALASPLVCKLRAFFSPLMIGQFPHGGFGYMTPPYAAHISSKLGTQKVDFIQR